MAYFAFSLIMMIPALGILAIAIVAYLIYKRIEDRKRENFEKRSN